jgi:hypothetical protein
MPRFILSWTDENTSDFDSVHTADSVEEAAARVSSMLDGEDWYDEDKADEDTRPADERGIEDFLQPALQAFLDQETEDGDLAKYLEAMRIGDEASLKCEEGEFKIIRER